MVAPISGPFQSTRDELITHPQYGWEYAIGNTTRKWYRQRKPYSLPLEYDFSERKAISQWPANYGLPSYTGAPPWYESWFTQAYNRAYGRFSSRLRGNAQFLNTFSNERKQALGMVRDRAIQLARFTRHLRRGNLLYAARELGMPTAPRRAENKRMSLADKWLEYSYGWKPLVSDIGSAINLICSEPPFGRVRTTARVSGEWTEVYRSGPVGTQLSWERRFLQISTNVRITADVRIVNPDVALLNSLGFINPVQFLYETIPFGFIADWFGNVSQVIGALTDTAGLELQNPHFGFLQITHMTRTILSDESHKPLEFNTVKEESRYRRVTAGRRLGISPPQLVFHGFKDSVPRVLNALALLTQQLSKIRIGPQGAYRS